MIAMQRTAAVLFAALLVSGAAAQGYPSKPVKLIVPFPPAGSADINARAMAQSLSNGLGQTFMVDNKPGAGGLLALEAAASAANDGYTLLVGATGPITISPSLYQDTKFDPVARLDSVAWFTTTIPVLVVRAQLKAANVKELIALSRASSPELTMASAGSGTIIHLLGEYFKMIADVRWIHVPYKGSTPALTDMVAGRVDLMIDIVPSSAPHVKAGKLRALAVTTQKRASQLPDVPTLMELGYKDFDISSWVSLHAPKGTPRPVIERLNAELNKALKGPELQARLAALSAEPEGGPPERLTQLVKADLERWARVIRAANVKVD